MPHLTVNGVTFPGEADSFSETPEWIGDVTGRAQSGALVESRTTRKRRWNVRSVFLQASEAEAWRLFLEGNGHNWRLATGGVSSKGVGPQSGGTYTFSNFAPPTGSMSCVTVGSNTAAGSISWNLSTVMGPGWTPSSGFTISVYRQDSSALGDTSSGYYRYLVTGSSAWSVGTANPSGLTQWRDGSTGSYGVGRWLELNSSGVLALWGKGNSASANAAHNYAMLTALPFALPSSWQSSLVDYTDDRRAASLPWISENPRITLGGDAIPDADGATVVARVQSLDQRNVRLGGAHRNNARVLTVEFIEV